MILFLDTISLKPKFFLIKKNNIIHSIHILEKKNMKISDEIVPRYNFFEKKNKFNNKLTKMIVLTGPGSYTGLRLGISFMYGMSAAKKIPLFGVSFINLLNTLVVKKNFNKTLLVIFSDNNQNFLCIPSNKLKEYFIYKFTDDISSLKIDFRKYSICVSNNKSSKILKRLFNHINDFIYADIENLLNNDLKPLLKKRNVIKPIYVSDNKLFD